MATKQFGMLKLHWSKRGFAFKWGEGEIHRLSFGRSETAAGRESEGGYVPNDPNDPNAGGYGGYGRGYDRGYDQGEYPGQEQDGYEQGVGYADESAPAGRYDVLYRSDWLTWLLLVVLPPLGIWIDHPVALDEDKRQAQAKAGGSLGTCQQYEAGGSLKGFRQLAFAVVWEGPSALRGMGIPA